MPNDDLSAGHRVIYETSQLEGYFMLAAAAAQLARIVRFICGNVHLIPSKSLIKKYQRIYFAVKRQLF